MIKRILPLWWLMLAWLLAMFGADFWDFNVMELFASVAIIAGAFLAIRASLRERHRKQKRKGIRITLGVFIEECRDLMVKCANEKESPPDLEDLASRLDSYIRSNLGVEYIVRIQNGAGLPMAVNSISFIEHRNCWHSLHVWAARLDQFITDFRD